MNTLILIKTGATVRLLTFAPVYPSPTKNANRFVTSPFSEECQIQTLRNRCRNVQKGHDCFPCNWSKSSYVIS